MFKYIESDIAEAFRRGNESILNAFNKAKGKIKCFFGKCTLEKWSFRGEEYCIYCKKDGGCSTRRVLIEKVEKRRKPIVDPVTGEINLRYTFDHQDQGPYNAPIRIDNFQQMRDVYGDGCSL